MEKRIHIVSFNIPWPANYGGVIDVYYKLKALHQAGVKIILHCFEYERPQAGELEAICEKIYYYRRKTGLRSNIARLPYNVYSRKDGALLNNLLKDNYPILFEGLHTCYYLQDKRLKKRFKVFRACNIEHDYYREIGVAEKNLLKKCFYYLEAYRFKWFQKTVEHADLLLPVSLSDTDYLKACFPSNHVEFIPCFHENDAIKSIPGQSDFILYHGKLSVKENEKAALYLIDHVFGKLKYTCIIAGMNPPKSLLQAAAPYQNIHIEANPETSRMNDLIEQAQINLLVTFQGTGLKLKLLNSLFAGRYIVVNSLMLEGSGLESLCNIADTPEEMIKICHKIMTQPFSTEQIDSRKHILFPTFSNQFQAERLIKLIFWDHK